MSSKSTYTSPLCSCIICRKEYSAKGIHSHYLSVHGTEDQKEIMGKGRLIGSIAGNLIQIQNKAQSKKKLIEEYSKAPNICGFCNKQLNFDKRGNKFCNSTCAGFCQSIEKREKLKEKSLGRKFPNRKPTNKTIYPHSKLSKSYFIVQTCTCCSKEFRNNNLRKTCSPECQRKNSTYRKIVHQYIHDNEIIFLESSWEVEIAKWLDERKIKWSRPKHIPWIDSSGKQRKYFPDFLLEDFEIYLDPKNDYQIMISKDKLDAIKSKVTLIYGKVDYIIDTIKPLIDGTHACPRNK